MNKVVYFTHHRGMTRATNHGCFKPSLKKSAIGFFSSNSTGVQTSTAKASAMPHLLFTTSALLVCLLLHGSSAYKNLLYRRSQTHSFHPILLDHNPLRRTVACSHLVAYCYVKLRCIKLPLKDGATGFA